MKSILKRMIILFVIFLLAVIGYFLWVQNRAGKQETVYTSMAEARLPEVYMNALGRKMNYLTGYIQDLEGSGIRKNLTLLPEDRNLEIEITRSEDQVVGIYYEIRTMDLSRLLERTSVESWQENGAATRVTLPVQNVISRDQEYLLILTVDTRSFGAIRYYSRILWTDLTKAQQMVDLAEEFSRKTFDYNQARDLTPYLESNDTGDNSNLGHVDIHSSFSQLNWGGLNMQRTGEVRIDLWELQNNMSQINLTYLTRLENEDGSVEIFQVEDAYTMRWNEQRIYMMDFDRQMNQLFTAGPELFSGNRIRLGITNEDRIQSMRSENGEHVAFVVNGDLWSMAKSEDEEDEVIHVFSFRSKAEEQLFPMHKDYEIKLLACGDDGNVDFLVYGYMNRGHHEGLMGVGMYRYNKQQDALWECFFTPVNKSFEELQIDLSRLSYLNPGDILYLKLGQGIFGVDLNSNESLVVAEGLTQGEYAVSTDGKHIAWQDGVKAYESGLIHLMNLETGDKHEIEPPEGDFIRVLGFVGNDLIYGLSRQSDEWIINGRTEDIPMYALEILGEDLKVLTRYEKPGYYIGNVDVREGRVHLKRLTHLQGSDFMVADEDTIVSNVRLKQEVLENVGWFASAERGKIYFIQTPFAMKKDLQVKAHVPPQITYEKSEILNLTTGIVVPKEHYYAYGQGRLLGVFEHFCEAVEMAHGAMGTVTNADFEIIWSRLDRPESAVVSDNFYQTRMLKYAEALKSGQSIEEAVQIFDARGCSLSQVLYFTGRKLPVYAHGPQGETYLISGYDRFNVTLYHLQNQESVKMGLNDAGAYFAGAGNDFICAIFSD